MMQTQGKPMSLKVNVKKGYNNIAEIVGPTCLILDDNDTRACAGALATLSLFEVGAEFLRGHLDRVPIGDGAADAKTERFSVELLLTPDTVYGTPTLARVELSLGDVLLFAPTEVLDLQQQVKDLHDLALARVAQAVATNGLLWTPAEVG